MAIVNGNNNDNNLVGTSAGDTIYGYEGNDRLSGNGGNDFLSGADGDDTLDGGAGFDTLSGGDGDDTYIVNSTTDTILEYEGGGSNDTVLSSVNYTLGDWLNNLSLTGSSAINGTGNELDNTITGNNANNILDGGGGNDTLIGGRGGGDTLYGGAGDDTLSGGDLFGSGTTYMYGGDGDDRLRGVAAYMEGGSGNDSLSGDYSQIYGGDGNDTLNGGYGSLYGGDGDDILSGSNVTMYGGPGNDTLTRTGGLVNSFGFNNPVEGVDTIVGFTAVNDFIRVSASGFGGGLTAGAAITPEQFVLGAAATEASHRFIYNDADGALSFDVDGIGGTEQQQFATLSTGLALSNSGILVLA